MSRCCPRSWQFHRQRIQYVGFKVVATREGSQSLARKRFVTPVPGIVMNELEVAKKTFRIAIDIWSNLREVPFESRDGKPLHARKVESVRDIRADRAFAAVRRPVHAVSVYIHRSLALLIETPSGDVEDRLCGTITGHCDTASATNHRKPQTIAMSSSNATTSHQNERWHGAGEGISSQRSRTQIPSWSLRIIGTPFACRLRDGARTSRRGGC